MKTVGDNVRCSKGNIIKLHDVCRSISTDEVVVIVSGMNKVHQLEGLGAVNDVTGCNDWLSIYPDGELEVLCNLRDGVQY
ncbi:MAG TPA: hypothetical protein H9983_01555 [Candidatus Kurthia intestinigallinarum]|nr:hypothetical protein [Candidatus Kurthia intestinigallinarum]